MKKKEIPHLEHAHELNTGDRLARLFMAVVLGTTFMSIPISFFVWAFAQKHGLSNAAIMLISCSIAFVVSIFIYRMWMRRYNHDIKERFSLKHAMWY